MAPGDNPEIFKDLIREHIPYEVRMLRVTFVCLALPSMTLLVNPLVVNSFLESFCIHARNLFEFFDEKRPVAKGYAAARHFAEVTYEPFPRGRVSEKKIGLLSKQIAHITYDRTVKQEEKLGMPHFVEFVRAIDDELQNFEAHLKATYKELWPPDMKEGCVRFG
jgi:hypothetical protein